MNTDRQLSFDVPLHKALEERRSEDTEPYLTGSLKISGSFHCPSDLNAGERVTVTVADEDGQVIAQGVAVATYPGFKEVTDRGIIIGTERINQAKLA